MVIGINSCSILPEVSPTEAETNNEASDYIANHYRYLLLKIKGFGVKDEKAEDLLHDVFISVLDSENNGQGFDMEYGTRQLNKKNANLMSVEQFVLGRIKLYAKNDKYKTNVIDAMAGSVSDTYTYTESIIGTDGAEVLDRKGNVKQVRKVEKNKTSVKITISAASFNDGGSIDENNDEFQKAFASASVVDSTDDIVERESLRERVNYCIDICDMGGVNILNIFRNIDLLSDMLGDLSKKRRSAESVFKPLTDLTEYHSELGQAIMDVLGYASKHREVFDRVIATY